MEREDMNMLKPKLLFMGDGSMINLLNTLKIDSLTDYNLYI